MQAVDDIDTAGTGACTQQQVMQAAHLTLRDRGDGMCSTLVVYSRVKPWFIAL